MSYRMHSILVLFIAFTVGCTPNFNNHLFNLSWAFGWGIVGGYVARMHWMKHKNESNSQKAII